MAVTKEEIMRVLKYFIVPLIAICIIEMMIHDSFKKQSLEDIPKM